MDVDVVEVGTGISDLPIKLNHYGKMHNHYYYVLLP